MTPLSSRIRAEEPAARPWYGDLATLLASFAACLQHDERIQSVAIGQRVVAEEMYARAAQMNIKARTIRDACRLEREAGPAASI